MKKSPATPTQNKPESPATPTQNKPAYGPANPPTAPPTRQPNTPAPVRVEYKITNKPTELSIQWVDNEEEADQSSEEEEEDWMESRSNKLYCGETIADAVTKCERSNKGNACPNGRCPNGLKCFMIGEGDCVDEAASNIIITVINKEEETAASNAETADTNTDEDVQMTFYCGSGPKDASYCRQRCPSGLSSECSKGERCYGYIKTCKEPVTSPPTRPPSQFPTKRPTPHPVNNIGKRKNYCAKAKADLELSCINAISCNKGEPACPDGTYCWGDYFCGEEETSKPTSRAPSTKPTLLPTFAQQTLKPTDKPPTLSPIPKKNDEPIIIDGTFLCATNEFELKEKCGLLKDCTGNSQVCEEGQNCMEHECKQSLDKCPLMYIGYHSTGDCKSYWHCTNGVAGVAITCEDGLKFDKVRGICINEEQVNQHCYGPPLTLIEEEQTLLDPTTYDKLCPDGYIGWTTVDPKCHKYYECKKDGTVGHVFVCGAESQFDKNRKECVDEDSVDVDSDCFGSTNTDLVLTPVVRDTTSVSPTTSPIDRPILVNDWASKAGYQTPQLGDSETPPWLAYEVYNNHGGVSCGMYTHIWLLLGLMTIFLFCTNHQH